VEVDLNSAERLAWERELLERAKRGERDAWGQLYHAFADVLFGRVLLPRLGDRAAAEDALSETFRSAIERVGQFDARGSSVYFWLSRIAVNKATDMHRARAVTGRAIVNLEAQLLPLLELPPTPHEALDGRNEMLRVTQLLSACVSELNPRYRRAIEMRFFEERSREDCAREMDVKLGTFDVLLLRSLKALRKQWEQRSADAKEGARVEIG
jgi:RNA polymerase sigma-70 factor (ECF subfamily)